jgi:uncharacterized protein involved in high-affinity Fe2+ transport
MVEEVSKVLPGGNHDVEPLEAACWFCAYRTAEAVLDCFRTKDAARLIVDAGSLGGPFKTEEDIDANYLAPIREDCEGDDNAMARADAELVADIHQFFTRGR